MRGWIVWALGASAVAAACGSSGKGTNDNAPDASAGSAGGEDGSGGGIGSGPLTGLTDGGWSTSEDAQAFEPVFAPDGAALRQADAGYPQCDGGVLPADDFITGVVSFEAGACAGFGQSELPGIVFGPPVGAGASLGGLDVVSLGNGGSIVVSFSQDIVDGPGPDFLVFENPFAVGGNPNDVYAEPGQVSVSEDGVNWTAFPCTATSYPYGTCAGWHPVFSNPDNCISPLDVANAGGDPFDLADVGVTSARYVKIVDEIIEACASNPADAPNTNGFDLDAIAILHGSGND
jgi:hypothetical protein